MKTTGSAGKSRISIAILALGGQGGGVLADWIQHVAEHDGWQAQGTSVPGVAQRTGSTVYYVELARRDGAGVPVMAQMPVPGDVDIVVASELMEAGRAMLRGFSTAERTTLIGSTHRIYAISEKTSMADGRGSSERIIAAAGQRAKRFIGFDMEAAAERSGSVISSIMFGALAGSGALPFDRQAFENAIRASGIAIDSNLKGFDEGFRAAQLAVAMPREDIADVPEPTSAQGRAMRDRIVAELPAEAHYNALHGVQRLVDYQDFDYARRYLDAISGIAAQDGASAELVTELARHLALWMSYEDTIRVADLKTRTSRVARVRGEVQAKRDQLLEVTEFMHPRLQEVCETLPAALGRFIIGSPGLRRILEPFFQEGRHVRTTGLGWFLTLRLLAGMRRFRPRSLRFVEEQARIGKWLDMVRSTVSRDPALALELVLCQQLVKGYGYTFERGLRNFEAIAAAVTEGRATTGDDVRRLREAALADDKGVALGAALAA